MQLGMIGLGRMGANIVRRLQRAGHECVVFDSQPRSRQPARRRGRDRRREPGRLCREAVATSHPRGNCPTELKKSESPGLPVHVTEPSQAAPDARTDERLGSRKGYQSPSLTTGAGTLSSRVPLLQERSFSIAFFASIISASSQVLVLTVMAMARVRRIVDATSHTL